MVDAVEVMPGAGVFFLPNAALVVILR